MRDDEVAAEDLREAITHLAHTASKLPRHWVDRRADLHHKMNELLDQLQLIEGWIECESAQNQDAPS